MKVTRYGVAAAVLAAFCVVPLPVPAHAMTIKELSCSKAVAKDFAALQNTILKITAKCHADDISGKVNDPNACDPLPGAAQAAVTAAKNKFIAAVAKSCQSTCSISTTLPCVSDLTCPPNHLASPAHNATAERCSGKAGVAPFDLSRLDWPGPYCPAILGHPMTVPTDLGTCLAAMVDPPVRLFDRAVFAGLDETSGLSATAIKCVGKISTALQTAIAHTYTATATCRDARRSAGLANSPAWACSSADPKAKKTVDTEIAKLSAAIAKSCTPADIQSLTGLCSDGAPPPTSVAEAQACLGEMVREVATEERGANHHKWLPIGMLNVTHPDSAEPYCGDGIVTPKREEHTGVGEECDGSNAPCGGGACLPPGDEFECTCDSVPRERFVVNGSAGHSDSDAGWKGTSHNATHNDGFGYVTEFSDCDCSEFSQATCTGTSSNPICTVNGNMAPRCSDDLHGTQTCDQRGDGNGVPQDSDCFRCDDNTINAGTFCGHGASGDETVCQSQCFDDVSGDPVVPQTPCNKQADCGLGKSCKGRCDNSLTCNTMTEGSPLPQVSAAISVCIMLEYKTDITGTKNIKTGETALHYTTRSNIQPGAAFTVPCPVCGGACVGGASAGASCFGRCNVSGDSCLDDTDCTGPGDTSCQETADDCSGGTCSLNLRCSGGPNSGKLCRPDAATPLGVVSHDCPPFFSNNLSGSGLNQPFGTVTTGEVHFPVPGAPCTDPSWHNYDCPCPADAPGISGVPTAPNSCAAACDGGVNLGKGCAVGDGSTGVYTTCVGGSDVGSPCDADSDCEGGACSGNPKQCTAGTANLIGHSCAVDGDCGGGGVCSDACPGAHCVPLCVTEGKCSGGARDGDVCATLKDCSECTAGNSIGMPCLTNANCDSQNAAGDGVCSPAPGVTCNIYDTEEGLCSAGPAKYRCTGAGFTTLPCSMDTGTCTSGHCKLGTPSLIGAACTEASDCLLNNIAIPRGCEAGDDGIVGTADDHVGAGDCEPTPQDCFVNNGSATGGDTTNGQGSPSDVNINAAFCVPPLGKITIDGVSGFGGPSRIRRQGSAFVNVPSIP